jgi:hypothetical protein
MLPSNSALHQHSPAQAQSPAHSEPFNISIRPQQPPSSFSNPFLGNQVQFSPTILIEVGRAHYNPYQQRASSSPSSNNNGPTTVPSNISSTPLQSIEFNANRNNGSHCDGSSQSSSFSNISPLLSSTLQLRFSIPSCPPQPHPYYLLILLLLLHALNRCPSSTLVSLSPRPPHKDTVVSSPRPALPSIQQQVNRRPPSTLLHHRTPHVRIVVNIRRPTTYLLPSTRFHLSTRRSCLRPHQNV